MPEWIVRQTLVVCFDSRKLSPIVFMKITLRDSIGKSATTDHSLLRIDIVAVEELDDFRTGFFLCIVQGVHGSATSKSMTETLGKFVQHFRKPQAVLATDARTLGHAAGGFRHFLDCGTGLKGARQDIG
jgi:hypothetical protein